MDYCYENPRNPNSSAPYFIDNMIDPSMDLAELSDYLMLDYDVDHHHHHHHQDSSMTSLSVVSSEKVAAAASSGSTSTGATSRNTNMKCRKNNVELGHRVAFKTKSELEVMDDGFKWRKYGKKSVKNSKYLRNYYKCSSGGCCVKKRVERDSNDSSYVITTYEGMHNHESPSVVYYNPMPPAGDPNNIWTLRPSSHSSPSNDYRSTERP